MASLSLSQYTEIQRKFYETCFSVRFIFIIFLFQVYYTSYISSSSGGGNLYVCISVCNSHIIVYTSVFVIFSMFRWVNVRLKFLVFSCYASSSLQKFNDKKLGLWTMMNEYKNGVVAIYFIFCCCIR